MFMAMARPPPVSIPEDTFQESLFFKALSSEPDGGEKVHLPTVLLSIYIEQSEGLKGIKVHMEWFHSKKSSEYF